MSENTPEIPGMSPEQVQAKIKEVQAAVSAFNADPRHERYQLSEPNKAALVGYIEEHNLGFTEDTLHLAYVECAKSGKLALFEESRLSTPDPPTKTVVEVAPPAVNALAEQQRARRQLDPGVGQVSNREAFRQAAQRASEVKFKSPRHL